MMLRIIACARSVVIFSEIRTIYKWYSKSDTHGTMNDICSRYLTSQQHQQNTILETWNATAATRHSKHSLGW